MKKKQKVLVISLVSVIVILSMALTASVVYNFIGGFYRSRVINYNKILGEEQTITVTGAGTFCTASNFSGITLLGVDIGQNIYIKTGELVQPVNLRAKAMVVCEQNSICDIFGYTNWVAQDDDDYIYFNQQVSSNEQIGMCKYVRLPQDLKLESNIDYVIIFILEAYV